MLEDGRFEGEPFVPGGAARLTVEMLDDMTTHGDLDGDGTDDAAVVLAVNSGGSGTRLYISAVTTRYGDPASYGTMLVGDRPQIRSIDIADGKVRFAPQPIGQGDPVRGTSTAGLREVQHDAQLEPARPVLASSQLLGVLVEPANEAEKVGARGEGGGAHLERLEPATETRELVRARQE